MAAVLSCGSAALLSHRSAAALWGIWDVPPGIEIVVPYGVVRRRPGIHVYRRSGLGVAERKIVDRIPVTDPVSTLVDLAAGAAREPTERAVNEADRLNLIDPEALRLALDAYPKRPGLARLRSVLDSWSFSLTDSVLERRFLALVQAAHLPMPETQAWVNGFRVDFYWSRLGLVVETDGLRYHRTSAQQARDRLRDQAHTAAGLTNLRFTAAQVRFEAAKITATLAAVCARLDGTD
jgi:very-short-patch-repair endonuclease